MEWLRQQGPWCPALLEYLERNHQQYDVLIFFTYLYAPTVLGVADRAAQEHPRADGARRAGHPPRDLQGAVQPAGRHRLQHRGRAAVPDDALLDPRGRGRDGRLRRRPAAGAPLPARAAGRRRGEPPRTRPAEDDAASPTKRRRPSGRTWRSAARCSAAATGCTVRSLLYGGRIDPGKGCEELIEYFSTYVQEGGDASLVLMGVKLMPLPEEPFIRFAGRLSDQERLQALEAATVVVVPSPYESLSLLALESFAVGTPILANARSEVLVDHCHKSNAGLYYADRDEFVECLRLLIADRAPARSAWAGNGRALRAAELPVGRDPGQVREDVHAAAAAGTHGRSRTAARPRLHRARDAISCRSRGLRDFAFVVDRPSAVDSSDRHRRPLPASARRRRRACGADGCRGA